MEDGANVFSPVKIPLHNILYGLNGVSSPLIQNKIVLLT